MRLWSITAVCFCGLHSVWHQNKPFCKPTVGFRVTVCCVVVWWGSTLLTERLRRRREAAVSLVVAAHRMQQLTFTTPSKRKQRSSTARPFWNLPPCYVITSYWLSIAWMSVCVWHAWSSQFVTIALQGCLPSALPFRKCLYKTRVFS